nr:uncharacterized protein LOC112211408 isoform X2 [Halyomorpha halys]
MPKNHRTSPPSLLYKTGPAFEEYSSTARHSAEPTIFIPVTTMRTGFVIWGIALLCYTISAEDGAYAKRDLEAVEQYVDKPDYRPRPWPRPPSMLAKRDVEAVEQYVDKPDYRPQPWPRPNSLTKRDVEAVEQSDD